MSGSFRRSIASRPASTDGGGSNASRWMRRSSRNPHQGSHRRVESAPGATRARLRAASYWISTSARTSARRGIVEQPPQDPRAGSEGQVADDPERLGRQRRSKRVGLDDAQPGVAAHRRAQMVRARGVELDRDDPPGASDSGRVSAPVPAPMSSTRSRRETPICSISSVASAALRRKCCPSDARPLGRGPRPCTATDHHRNGSHAPQCSARNHRRCTTLAVMSAAASDTRYAITAATSSGRAMWMSPRSPERPPRPRVSPSPCP